MKRKIVAVVENHFDQLWRRCFERDFQSKGKNYVSYSKIQQYYIEENLKLCEKYPEYKFQIETPCAVETYLKSFPEQREKLKELYSQGKLRTPSTGYLIVDSNMVGEETIIKNFLLAEKFFSEFGGKTPNASCRSDAFGNSAQLPQILKNFGATHVRELAYVPYDDDVWLGLDGSAICVKNHRFLGMGGGWSKLAPCPECSGFGVNNGEKCSYCGGRGVDEKGALPRWTDVYIRDDESESGVIQVGGEEVLPQEKTVTIIEKIRREKDVDIHLGFEEELLDIYADEIEKIEKGDFNGLKVRESREFNPNNTGCFTTRIKTKQSECEIENKLLACESLKALGYADKKSAESYDEAWKNMMLSAFHDSVTGTMVDAPYYELLDIHEGLRAFVNEKYLKDNDTDSVTVYNPSSFERSGIYESSDGKIAIIEKIKPYCFADVHFEEKGVITREKPQINELPKEAILTDRSTSSEAVQSGEIFFIENEYFVIEADNNGLRAITDKRFGAVSAISNGERPFEFVIESDVGSPWATLEEPARVFPLAERTAFVSLEKGEKFTKLNFKTSSTMQMCDVCNPTIIEWSLTLFKGYDKIRFDAKVNWRSINKRLRVRFPLSVSGRDIYGIPGGYIERAPYEPSYAWAGSNGDWPAYRWGGVESENKSIAIFNRGTPSYRILPSEKGDKKTLAISLLRSPSVATYLHEPTSYSMTDWDTMRDEGMHEISLELACYGSAFPESGVVKDAESFARPFLSVKEKVDGELPFVLSGGALVSHCKVAEDENGIIARISEISGSGGRVTVSIPRAAKAVYKTDMPEKAAEKLEISHDGSVTLDLRAFEIASIRIVY